MINVSSKDLLKAGAHFGHQTRRWDPKMRPYIFAKRSGIHIIDLEKSHRLLERAADFVKDVAKGGGRVLFVGTKRQAQQALVEQSERCGMYHVTERWLGGTLTNFRTIKVSIDKMKRLEHLDDDREFETLTKKERLMLAREHTKLSKILEGIKDMADLPSVIFIVDTRKESIAIQEARKLKIPVVAMVDTNCDPTAVDFPVPCNDDAVRSIALVSGVIADAVLEGREEGGIPMVTDSSQADESAPEVTSEDATAAAEEAPAAEETSAEAPGEEEVTATSEDAAAAAEEAPAAEEASGEEEVAATPAEDTADTATEKSDKKESMAAAAQAETTDTADA